MDIKERCGKDGAVEQNSDLPGLLHDEQPATAVTGIGDCHR